MTNDDLRKALSAHLEETRGQVVRLEQAFESLDLKPKGKHCAGMAGILEEGHDLLEEDGTKLSWTQPLLPDVSGSSITRSSRMAA